ncbi:MAG TPA: serine hydrolase domain-containing protein [Thermoanaerobaculia bacterium]|nr:serine hydrolase domain-containing protein [Thermoanaerobaculia bacterium]
MRSLVLTLFLLTGCASSETHTLLSRYAMYGFDGVALVSKHGRVLTHDAFGRATVHQRYDAGSIMKTFVAAAILQLEAQGRLRTSDTVAGPITIHQLLTHTSGLPLDPPNSTDDLFDAAAKAKLVAAPGERYSYSNFGYGLLLGIVERASGQPFAGYARAHLLEPAGMRESRFWTEPALPGEAIAAAFTGNSDEELEPAEPLVRNGPNAPMWGGKYTFGAAGILTTAADLERWWRWLTKHPELQRYGWNTPPNKIYRGGLVRASFISMLAYYREHDAVLIYLINRNTGWHLPIEKNVERILARQPYVLPPPVVRGKDVLPIGDSQQALSLLWSLTPEQRAAAANAETLVKQQMSEPFEILGTTRHPSSARNLQTFVRTGDTIQRVITDGTKVLAVAKGVPPSAMRRFRPTGNGTYASYDPATDSVITARKTDAGYVLENAAGERVVLKR